jgi:DNA-binding response OmpR family regulator
MPMEVLVVDDNTSVRELLRRYLKPQGIRVREASDAASAVECALRTTFDVVLIDWVLQPWGKEGVADGVGVCQALRAAGETAPIVMYSAVARSASALVRALDAGADGFIESPLANLEELAARLRAIQRRREWERASRAIEVESMRIEPDRRIITVEGSPVSLTKMEFDLLTYLSRRQHRTVSHDELFDRVLHSPRRVHNSNALVMLVQRLRSKLGRASPYVQTVRGIGYRVGAPKIRASHTRIRTESSPPPASERAKGTGQK